MLLSDPLEIERLVDAEIQNSNGCIVFIGEDYREMKDIFGEPYAAIVTDYHRDIHSLVSELTTDFVKVRKESLDGLLMQIHSNRIMICELDEVDRALYSLAGSVTFKRFITRQDDMPENTHKAVVVLFARE